MKTDPRCAFVHPVLLNHKDVFSAADRMGFIFSMQRFDLTRQWLSSLPDPISSFLAAYSEQPAQGLAVNLSQPGLPGHSPLVGYQQWPLPRRNRTNVGSLGKLEKPFPHLANFWSLLSRDWKIIWDCRAGQAGVSVIGHPIPVQDQGPKC